MLARRHAQFAELGICGGLLGLGGPALQWVGHREARERHARLAHAMCEQVSLVELAEHEEVAGWRVVGPVHQAAQR